MYYEKLAKTWALRHNWYTTKVLAYGIITFKDEGEEGDKLFRAWQQRNFEFLMNHPLCAMQSKQSIESIYRYITESLAPFGKPIMKHNDKSNLYSIVFQILEG